MTESDSSSPDWLERWILSIEKRVLHLGEKHGHLTARIELMEQRQIHGPASSMTSDSQRSTVMQAVERILSIFPTAREAIIWLIPRLIIGWGILEGWWAAGWHTIKSTLGL